MALVLLLTLCLILIAWLTASATAVRSVSRIWLRHWVEQRLSGASAAEAYIERPQRLLLASSAGATIVMALAGALLGAHHADRRWWLVGDVVVFATAVLLIGQLLPRAVARRWAPRLVPLLLPALRVVSSVLSPIVGTSQAIARAIVGRATVEDPERARDEIEDLLREGELEGIGEPNEIEIITGVVQFGEKVLRDVMTARTEVFAVDEDTPPRDMALAIAESGYSRVPVYRGSLDEIVGMVHVFDVLKAGAERTPPVRRVGHAPASKRCSELLVEMRREQLHLAVVLDEFGGTAGVVTLEDLLEELVGDIRDEHDEPAAVAAAAGPAIGTALAARVFKASVDLDEVAACFGVVLSDTTRGAHSLGGLLVRALGRIPTLGERFRLAGLEVVVIEAEPARVLAMLVHRPDAASPVELKISE